MCLETDEFNIYRTYRQGAVQRWAVVPTTAVLLLLIAFDVFKLTVRFNISQVHL